MQKKLKLLASILLLAVVAEGQSVQQVQERMIYFNQSLEKWDTSSDYKVKYDSLESINKKFLDYLKTACENNPSTIRANFKLPKYSAVNILTSDDKRFRIYCWGVGGDGTARSYDVLIQYQIGNKTKTVINDASGMPEGVVCSGSYYTMLYTIKTKDSTSVYITVDHAVFASGNGENTISACTIKDRKLITIPFFKTATKKVDEISFEYDLSEPVNKHVSGEPDIKVSEDKKKICVPEIKENGAITSKYLVYKFDGYNYVFDKNAK